MGSVSYGLGANLSLPPCLSVTIGIWTSAHKSDPRAEISENRLVRRSGTTSRGTVVLVFPLRMHRIPLCLGLTIFVGMKWIVHRPDLLNERNVYAWNVLNTALKIVMVVISLIMKSAVAIIWKMLVSLISMSSFIRQLSCWDGSGEFHYTLGCYSDIDQKPQQTRSQDFFHHCEVTRLSSNGKAPGTRLKPQICKNFTPFIIL